MLYNVVSLTNEHAELLMETSWINHLQKLGGRLSSTAECAFREPLAEVRAAAAGDILAILDHLAIIRVTGEDSETFLQGQFSNDIKHVTPQQAQLSSWCSPKGRVLTQLLVMRQESGYILVLPRAVLDTTLKRLRMFVLRSKVSIEDVSTSLVCLGCAGPGSPAHLSQLYGKLPVTDYAMHTATGIAVIRIPGLTARYLLIGNPDNFVSQWARLSLSQVLAGNAPWQWLDIQAGLPSVLPGIVDEFVPQMLNLEVLGAVNFTKGCYPGQEIVARTHYLGKVKRRLYKAHVDQIDFPLPGQDIYSATAQGQSVGKLVSAQLSPHGGMDVLAVIQREAADSGELQLGQVTGHRLHLQPLPYAVDQDPS
jgi:tRNA-modifying protein YgfZ